MSRVGRSGAGPANPASAANPAGAVGHAELAEIHSLPSTPAVLKARATLQPEEEALSLPQPELPDPKIALLNRVLGTRLTTDNPLWSGDPVPPLRALQKALIAHSLTLPQPERRPCLDALTVIERAVLLRLRWQQMRRSDAEAPAVAVREAARARPAANDDRTAYNEEEIADATPHTA